MSVAAFRNKSRSFASVSNVWHSMHNRLRTEYCYHHQDFPVNRIISGGWRFPNLMRCILASVHGSLRNQHMGIISMKIETLLLKIKHFLLSLARLEISMLPLYPGAVMLAAGKAGPESTCSGSRPSE
jgi:hypothetical protein